jgi:hypothetical protein
MQPTGFLSIYVVFATFCIVALLLRAYRKQAHSRRVRRIESRLFDS